jgi:hypothetical protein
MISAAEGGTASWSKKTTLIIINGDLLAVLIVTEDGHLHGGCIIAILSQIGTQPPLSLIRIARSQAVPDQMQRRILISKRPGIRLVPFSRSREILRWPRTWFLW